MNTDKTRCKGMTHNNQGEWYGGLNQDGGEKQSDSDYIISAHLIMSTGFETLNKMTYKIILPETNWYNQ